MWFKLSCQYPPHLEGRLGQEGALSSRKLSGRGWGYFRQRAELGASWSLVSTPGSRQKEVPHGALQSTYQESPHLDACPYTGNKGPVGVKWRRCCDQLRGLRAYHRQSRKTRPASPSSAPHAAAVHAGKREALLEREEAGPPSKALLSAASARSSPSGKL